MKNQIVINLLSLYCLLALLPGCVTIRQQPLVFGPAKPDETSISLQNLDLQKHIKPKPKAQVQESDKSLDEMSREELLEHVQTLKNPKHKASKPPAAAKSVPEKKISNLSFKVKNNTGKVLWTTCFAYIQKQSYTNWRWDKSSVVRLEPGQTQMMQVDQVYSKDIEKNIFGYLGIFKTPQEAENSTFELLPDAQKLDLDLIYKIGNNVVTIDVERYGAEGEKFDYDLTGKQIEQLGFQPELDFFVENKIGKTIYLTCFIYQQPNESMDDTVWRYTKTPLQKLEPNEIGIIDVASMRDKYEAQYARGVLGVFDEDELEEAKDSTFQLIPDSKKITLDRLATLKGMKIVLTAEKYGSKGDFIDFVVKTKSQRKPGESVGS